MSNGFQRAVTAAGGPPEGHDEFGAWLRARHRFWDHRIGELTWPFFESRAAERWMVGGSQSTKTTCAVLEMIRLLTGLAPLPMVEAVARGERRFGHAPFGTDRRRLWVALMPSFKQGKLALLDRIEEWLDPILLRGASFDNGFHKADGVYTFWNDNRLALGSIEAGLGAAEGSAIDGASQDEDIEKQLQERLGAVMSSIHRGFTTTKKLFVGSFTPYHTCRMGGVSWFTRNVSNPEPPQLPPTDCEIISWPMWANPAVGTKKRADEIARNATPPWVGWEYACRVEGRIVSASASPVFSPEVLAEWEGAVEPGLPIHVVGEEVIEGGSGMMLAWARPVAGRQYAAGVDVGRGAGADWSVAWVFDRREREFVAVARTNRVQPLAFATATAPLLLAYGAKTAVERNENGLSVIDRYRELGVDLYRDRARGKVGGRKPKAQYGFPTSDSTRQPLIDYLADAVLRRSVRLRDAVAVRELRTIHWDEDSGRPDHPPGGHDDNMVGLMAALEADRVAGSIHDARAKEDRSGLTEKQRIALDHVERAGRRADDLGRRMFGRVGRPGTGRPRMGPRVPS